MNATGRVTDAVNFFQQKGHAKGAVRVVRSRSPERFRWRRAVGSLTETAGRMTGLSRMRIEEPVREVVLDVGSRPLKKMVVLDARIHGVDLDRGEVLPHHRFADIRRMAFLAGVDLARLQPHMPLPTDVLGPVDSAAAILVSSAIAGSHRRLAQAFWGRLPGAESPVALCKHHQRIEQRADREAQLAKRWDAFALALMREQAAHDRYAS